MEMLNLITILLFSMLITIEIEGKIDITLKYCRFKCANRCAKPKEDPKEKSKVSTIEGFYWRDFYGKIPFDAYPLGKPNQNPQTYIGSVFDPSKNGSFITTIVEGLDYVYSTLNGTVTKLNEIIQILCTSQPERLTWKNLTKANVQEIEKNYVVVQGPGHFIQKNNYPRYVQHFIVKTEKCKVSYVGYQNELEVETEFVILDGTIETTEDVQWLLYKNDEAIVIEEKEKPKPYISHHYSYMIRPNSIIPSFYKQLNIGSCSLTCTNEGKEGGKGKSQNSEQEKKSSTAQAYYWKWNEIWKKQEGIVVSSNDSKEVIYIGQTISTMDWFESGRTRGEIVYFLTETNVAAESSYIQILCTNDFDRFEWVPSSASTFAQLDKTRMVPGGELDNGTRTYVGRYLGRRGYDGGTVRELVTATRFYSWYETSDKFEVLMLKEKK